MRHGGGAFLSGSKVFLGFQNFCALQMADFQSYLFKSGGNDCQHIEKKGVTVTLDDLCGNIYGFEFHVPAGDFFHLRVQVSIVAHCSRELSHADGVNRLLQAADVALGLVIPEGKLKSKGGGLCMDAMRTPHTDGVSVCLCLQFEDFAQAVQFRQYQQTRLP